MKKLILLYMVLLIDHSQQACVSLWNADLNDPSIEICPVMTESREYCKFPFTYGGIDYKNCIIFSPNSTDDKIPQCLTTTGQWSNCLVPTDAVVNFVTTRKNGGYWVNTVSRNGGTMLWIYGKRFAQNLFSFSPSAETTNQVILTNDLLSYTCEIHTDKVTSSQITCFAPAMPIGKYKVRVLVNGHMIPLYQYANLDQAVINVADSHTPKLNSINPITAPPGSMITLKGDFKTLCYTRDVDPCADDSGARVSRIYFGGQICNLLNPETNEVYQNLTTDTLVCKLQGHEVNMFNASVLVSEEYGRSLTSGSLFYVSPDDKLYNFASYAQINGISHSTGSVNGGLKLVLTGNHFYSDEFLKAKINIGNTECKLVDFQQNNYVDSVLECETDVKPNEIRTYFSGGRGINLIVDNVTTDAASLETTSPSPLAAKSTTDKMSVSLTQVATVWFKGFFAPLKSGNYDFPVETDGYAKVFLSTDEDPVNKVIVTNTATNVETKKILEGGKLYYFEAIGSKATGPFNLKINSRMYNTLLTDSISSNVKNEEQEIEIKSTIVKESFTIDYSALTPVNGTSEVQRLILNSSFNTPYVLSFNGVDTIQLDFESTSLDIQKALNDIPSLSPNLVEVSFDQSSDPSLKIFKITFSSDLGDVNSLTLTGDLKSEVLEDTKGVPSGRRVQLNIEGSISPLIALNETTENIKAVINKTLGIRCPSSIQDKTPDVHAVYDYETCSTVSEGNLNETVFCGQCSKKDSSVLFTNAQAQLVFKYLCFAYKLKTSASKLDLQFKNSAGTIIYKSIPIVTKSDQQWHYTCVDIISGVDLSTVGSVFIHQVSLSPFNAESYFDTVSLRKTIVKEDPTLVTTRRMYPKLSIIPNSLTVTQGSNSLTVSYRPNNCANNLSPVSSHPSITVTRVTQASPPINGTFSLQWGGQTVNNIPADITQDSLKSYLESVNKIGVVTVVRSKDCAGYKWKVRFETGGDKDQLEIGTQTLTGNTPIITSTVIQNGYALFSPVMENLARTYHSKPQVTVLINDVLSKCDLCDFEWSNSSTPTVTDIDTTDKTLIVITGQGFDTTPSNNLVLIGETQCTVTQATSSSLTCVPGEGPLGTFKFNVIVLGKGKATLSSNSQLQTFTFELIALGVSPNTGGTGGGVIVNITGKGFTRNTLVKIDGKSCNVKLCTYNTITCEVPPSLSLSNSIVNVDVIEGDQTKTITSGFTYDFDNTPKVTSISKTKLSVIGDEQVTIQVSFPTENIQIYIGSKLAKVIRTTENSVTFLTPAMNPGKYRLLIPTGSLGYASIQDDLEYVFYVSSFTPNLSSKRGGTRVVINGAGFNTVNCSSNKVSFERYNCKVLSCSSDKIVCETEPAHTVYEISNKGLSPKWGYGYAWDVPYVELNISDVVRWSWSSQNGISGLKFMVQQLRDPILVEAEGFWSGRASEKGTYEFQFNKPGTFYYWSGFIEPSRVVHFRGVVVVKDVQETKDLQLEVTQGDIKALKCVFPFVYKGVSYSSCTSQDESFSWCATGVEGVKIPCDPTTVDVPPSCSTKTLNDASCKTNLTGSYTMRFTDCQVPTITSISPLNVTYATEITITGTYFSDTLCENEVTIGGKQCTILSSTSGQLVCKLNKNSQLKPNQNYSVEVNVKNKGFALKQDNFIQVYFKSVAISVTPTTGSTNGGAFVSISGDGFDQDTKVQIGSRVYTYQNSEISYSSINFITEPGYGLYNVTVSNNGQDVVYETSLTYEFNPSVNPVISAINPLQIDKETNMTLTGSNFGSNMKIKIGTQDCVVLTSSATSISCNIKGLETGEHSVKLNVKTIGDADTFNQKVTGVPTVQSITPSSGSTNGGTRVKLIGNGFTRSSQVLIGGVNCSIVTVKINEIECETLPHASGSTSITVTTQGVSHTNTLEFTYDSTKTPVITSFSPLQESTVNSVLTITGTNFVTSSSEVHVTIGGSQCAVTESSETQIKCTLGLHGAGSYPIELKIDSFGRANSFNQNFLYALNVNSLSSSEGSLAGGLQLKLTGSGFSSNTTVTVCSNQCKLLNQTTTELFCLVPSANSTIDKTCTLTASENGLTATSSYVYKANLTSKVLNVLPLRGGTGGGTLITINGENFPSDQSKVTVKIADSVCTINFYNTTTIRCRTEAHPNSSIKSLIQVYVDGVGNALNNDVFFEYIDLWSSRFTWGGMDPPTEGDLVVISQGQTIYFDTHTPILKGIIIIGGGLIFDDSQDVHLQCEYIIIVDGGRFQIGTEDKPFLHNAEITMYGTARSIELPIFGSKVIAVRNGTIDMHGKPVGVTWTRLGQTAIAGSTQIKLQEPVIWEVGSEIVIATTGDKFSPGESEVRTLVSKLADNQTFTLDKPLNFTHLSEVYQVGEGLNIFNLEKKAEVGLLTRNIKYRGKNDDSWNSLKSAKACPEGFDPSEFAIQTCFLGRYGDEIGSDEFGATIMIHGDMEAPNGKKSVVARIQNVELNHVGQSFRIGRYPIHFHMNGDLRGSYVKECSIRKSFNRAVNIHGTNYVVVSRNFIYDIMGGAYFLEDGVEIGNEFSYNLAIFVKSSSSLLNEDSTPAAYWVTNPNNTVIHNAVGGGTHFGFWYRILDRPDGPSFNQNYCPKKIPLGRFFNNSIHSSGRMGLWIFPGYTPTVSGSCWDDRPSVAKFESMTSYGNEKGCEWVFSNSIQFKNFVVFDQYHVGIETKNNVQHNVFSSGIPKLVQTFYNESIGTAVIDSVIVGNTNSNSSRSLTDSGLVLAWDRGQLIKNVTFINFPSYSSHALRGPEIIGTCTIGCGGWITKFKDIKFINVQIRGILRWDWDLVYQDLDGSLTGSLNNVIVYNNNLTSNNPNCASDSRYINGTVCKNTKGWIRFAWNELTPNLAIRTNFTNTAGHMATIPKLGKRLTHKEGFMAVLEANQEYIFEYVDALYPTNISYNSGFYNVEPGNWIIIKHIMSKKPDRVYFGTTLQFESFVPLTTKANTGSWYWDNSTLTLSYIINNNRNVTPFLDYMVQFNAYVCRYVGCEPPVDPAYKLPVTERPPNALFWSDITTWSFAEPGWGGYVGTRAIGGYELPKDGQSVKIPDGKYVVVDCPIPKLKNLQIEGVLEFDNGLNHTLSAELIFINGGQLIIGWENNPMMNNVDIILRGSKDSLNFYLPDGMNNIGGKGIGVYGGLDLHGRPRVPAWTSLAHSSLVGSNEITLNVAVDWLPSELIVIGSTSFHPNQTEIFKIVSKSSDNKTLTLNATLKYDHIGYGETYANGQSYRINAPVGLLSRNIRIIGESYALQGSDLYGTRTIVSDYSTTDTDGNPVFYKGYARVSNVEFDRFGQFSRNSDDDYKYGILFSNLGNYNYTRPSYVRNSAFHHGYAAAVGILNSHSIPIENNVIHQTLDFGIFLGPGHSNKIKRNLLVYVLWSSSILTWEAEYNTDYWGAIDAHLADSAVIEDNFIDGVERLGLFYKGEPCQGESLGNMNHSINGNIIYSTLSGAVILPKHFYENITCVQMKGFTVFKAMHWGLYYQGPQSIVLDNNKLIDNYVGAFTFVYGPSGTEHIFSNKYYENKNSLIVGQSPVFNCVKDVRTFDLNYNSASKIKSFGAGPNDLGRIGLVWSNFIGGQNGAPVKPWPGLMTWNALDGRTLFENLTFTNFNEQCGVRNYILTTNAKNDDGQHPIMMKGIKLYQVENSSKVWMHRPNLGKINIWDCIDMDCDAMKKALLNDLDGSFLGQAGSVIPQSEFGWGSQQRGLGDFRIPKELLAAPNGSMIPPNQTYKYPGIVRDENLCKYINDWQAYECHGIEHRMLMIESMDPDTLHRRLSPIAIHVENKYLDLINGPQDQGCCFGYTCLKRLSTFMSIVASNQNVDIYLTSTAPKQLRFRLLDADPTYKVRLSMHYFTSNRIDLYKNDRFVPPTNAYYENGKMMLRDTSLNLDAYMPHYLNDSGTNLAVRDRSKVYFTIGGSDYIDLKVTPTVYVKFGVPAITESSFFEPANIVRNFAALLGIPESKIRSVKIIAETGSRKRRATSTTFIALTIMEDPVQTITNLADFEAINQQIQNLTASIVNRYATGELDQVAQSLLNVTLTGLLVQKPNSNATDNEIRKVNNIVIETEADKCGEMVPCQVQPVLRVINDNAETLLNMGNDLYPWIVQAELYDASSPTAKVVLQTEAPLENDGYVRFQNLSVSEVLTSFKIRYSFKKPPGLTNSSYTPPSRDSTKTSSSSKAEFTCSTKDENLAVLTNSRFNLTVSVLAKSTLTQVKNLDWKNHTWEAKISMYQLDSCNSNGSLRSDEGIASANLADGTFNFENLYITKSGMYLLIISLKTSNNEYQFSCLSKTVIVSDSSVSLDSTIYPSTFLKFEGDFKSFKDKADQIKAKIFNCFINKYGLKLMTPISVYSGSVMVNFDISGSANSNTEFAQSIAKGVEIFSGLKLVSATVNDQPVSVKIESSSAGGSSNTLTSSTPIGYQYNVIMMIVMMVLTQLIKLKQ